MVLKFNLDIMGNSVKWCDDAQKETFIENFKYVVQQGLMMMTVPDWTVKNVTVEEVDEEGDRLIGVRKSMSYSMSLGMACTLCGECVDSCSTKALTIVEEELKHNQDKCAYCEVCVDVCPECAIRIYEK